MFAPSRVWVRTALPENRWSVASHATCSLIEFLECEPRLQVPLRRRCLPGCGHATPVTRDMETTFVYRLQPRLLGPSPVPLVQSPSLPPSGGKTLKRRLSGRMRLTKGVQTIPKMNSLLKIRQLTLWLASLAFFHPKNTKMR